MADQTTQFIVGDVAVDALTTKRKRRFFRSKKQREPLTHCENCDAPLAGEYCAQCGQHAIDYRRSLMRLMIDAADSLLNWDTKFLHTVVVLLWKPWQLTNDFNAGRRVRYVHPLRLYLIASIAFFLLAKLVHLNPADAVELSAEDRAQIAAALGKLSGGDSQLPQEQRVRIDAARARWAAPETIPDPKAREKFERAMMKLPKFADKRQLKPQDLAKIEAALKRLDQIVPPEPPLPPEAAAGQAPSGPAPDSAGPRADVPSPPDNIPRTQTPPTPAPEKPKRKIQFNSGIDGDLANKSPFEKWMEERIKAKIGEDGTNVQLFLETLRNNIPTMMLCCIPLFALVLKILYVRQRRYYIEHLVYALHIHTFVYVAVVVISLVAMLAERVAPPLQTAAVLVLSFTVFAQVFLSIRRVYRQGWFMTSFKFGIGGITYLVVLSTAVGVTAFITLVLP
jgi:hypothetical protein